MLQLVRLGIRLSRRHPHVRYIHRILHRHVSDPNDPIAYVILCKIGESKKIIPLSQFKTKSATGDYQQPTTKQATRW